jgi:outer membrane protein
MNERGYRGDEGNFTNEKTGVWWSKGTGENAFAIFDDVISDQILINPKLNKYNTNIYFICGKNGGFFVRCVKEKLPEGEIIKIETELKNLDNIGLVNSQSLLDTMPSRDLALKEIKEIEDEFKLELNGMYEEYEKTRAKLEGERATLSPTIIKSREANLMNLGQRIQEREQTVQSELQVRAQELNQPIFDRVKQAVDIVADRKKLNYVIDASNMLYSKGGMDITGEVIIELLKLDAAAINKK